MTTQLLQFEAPVDLQAAEAEKPIQASIVAYSGGLMQVNGFGAVALVLAGLELPSRVPILSEHQADVANIIGSGVPAVAGSKLNVAAQLLNEERTQRMIALQKTGASMQASVGVEPLTTKRLAAGESETINGKSIKAPAGGLTVVIKGRLREVSIVALGADSRTSVAIAANNPKGTKMSVQTKTDPESENSVNSESEVLIERRRCTDIMATARDYPKIRDQAIAEGWNIETTKSHVLDAIRASRPQGPAIHTQQSPSMLNRSGLEAAILIQANREALAVKHYGAQVTEQARAMRRAGVAELCAAALQLEGREVYGMSRSQLIRAGVSTLSLPESFANVMGKTLVDAYQQLTSTWRGFAKIMPAADFRPQRAIRPNFGGNLEPVGPGGQIKHAPDIDESAFPWQIDTIAKNFGVTRQDMINDDLGIFDSIENMMAKAAARTVNDLVWKVILSLVGTSHFGTGNNNKLTAGSNLRLTSFEDAMNLMRSQKDKEKNDIQIAPAVLAVSPGLEATARGLLNSLELGRTDGQPTGNPFQNAVSLAVESRISNTGKFAGASTAGWFLFGSPMDAPVIVGFLEGNENPTVETLGFNSDPDTLAMTFRCYHDVGAAAGDPKAAVYATGAAG